MSNKIITKQFSHEEAVNKSRHLTGFNRWARSSRILGFVMLVLEWFTIPFEIILRRDFGERWITAVNFLSGFFLLGTFTLLQFFWHYVVRFFASIKSSIWHILSISGSNQEMDISTQDASATKAMIAIMALYILFGSYQLFKIKWRNQVNYALHSFDDGTSRFLWLAAVAKWGLNYLTKPGMAIFWLLIPANQRKGKAFPKLIQDRDAFANLCIEPGIVILLGVIFSGIASFYFFVSATALFMHSYWKEMARKSKKLDFQDSKIEAEIMRELQRSKSRTDELLTKIKGKSIRSNIKTNSIKVEHGQLSQIISEYHHHRNSLGNQVPLRDLIKSLHSNAIKREN